MSHAESQSARSLAKPRNHLQVIRRGYDGKTCWVHARAGVVRDDTGQVDRMVLTMQQLMVSGSDVFSGLWMMLSRDNGQTWEGPTLQAGLQRWHEPDGIEAVACDFTPMWHAVSGRLLGTGHVARYLGDKLMPPPRPRDVAYAVFDAKREAWGPVRLLALPDEDWTFNVGAGSGQRVDLPDGDVLLSVYGSTSNAAEDGGANSTRVLRCGFDGRTLSLKEAGAPLHLPICRGLYEPSLTAFGGRYYLTLRNDEAGYVSVSDDGLHFEPPRKWLFDDGSDLGNYNTQQHWLRFAGRLYLVYTRRGLNNDHVFRHRAPLVMAEVDPDRLCVIRDTEQIVVPERGARLGNFGVTEISGCESWVTVAEWMQSNDRAPGDPFACSPYGSDNSVFVACIH